VTPQEELDPAKGTAGTAPLFAVDQTGTMAYLRRSNMHVERRLELAARRGRTPDGMMHFGAALHTIEDLFAHSNWIEMAANRVLERDAKLLPTLKGKARQVFTFSAEQAVGKDQAGKPVVRPILQTGSFIGADTKVSLTSELTKFMAEKPKPPATPAERQAEQAFMAALLRTFESQLRANKPLNDGLKRTLVDGMTAGGMPKAVAEKAAEGVLKLPFADIYELTRIDLIPEWVRRNLIDPVQAVLRDQLWSQVLQPLAARLQQEALNAQVADTSLIQALRDQQKRQTQAVGDLSAAERKQMEATERLTGASPEQQNREARASAKSHVEGLQATPERVVAGPSHSQLSKDHPNSPFFGLAFKVAAEAVRRLRQRMVAAWEATAGGPTRPFNFEFTNFPAVDPTAPKADQEAQGRARDLYHASRQERAGRESRSLERGKQIVSQGGDVEGQTGTFQPYDIATMRKDSANTIRSAATGLRGLAGTPSEAAKAFQELDKTLDTLGLKAERVKRTLETLAAAGKQAGQGDSAKELLALADELEKHAANVEAATQHGDRERLNASLVATRSRVFAAFQRAPALNRGISAAVLAILDQQIAETRPSYTSEQRAVLEGRTDLREHTGARGPLATTTVALGDAGKAIDPTWHGGVRPAAVKALIEESRLLLNHPYENAWWEGIVKDHIRANEKQLLADIEARNAGYATLRRAGEPRAGQHGH
jgi:hypothetical protein